MSKELENDHQEVSEPAATDDPFGLKKGATGIFVLVIVCSLFWGLAKFGPNGANWIGDQTKKVFGLAPKELEVVKESVSNKTPNSPEVLTKPEAPEQATETVESDPPANLAMKPSGNQKIDHARKQILEALGGSDQAVIKHIAFSEDEQSMVAAVVFSNSPEMVEIYFDKDHFGRYISTPESPVEKEIKVWDEP